MRLLIPFALFSGLALAKLDPFKKCCIIWSFTTNTCLDLGYPSLTFCFPQDRPPPGIDPKCGIWNIKRNRCEEYKDGFEDGFNPPPGATYPGAVPPPQTSIIGNPPVTVVHTVTKGAPKPSRTFNGLPMHTYSIATGSFIRGTVTLEVTVAPTHPAKTALHTVVEEEVAPKTVTVVEHEQPAPTSVKTVTVVESERPAPTSVETATVLAHEQPAPSTLYTMILTADL